MSKEKLIKSVMVALFAMASTQAVSASLDATQSTEKCYGVVKAGRNDCNSAKASCAGSSTKDRQPDAYVLMPKGLCEKLVGAHLEPHKNLASSLELTTKK